MTQTESHVIPIADRTIAEIVALRREIAALKEELERSQDTNSKLLKELYIVRTKESALHSRIAELENK